MLPAILGETQLGRDMLSQDVVLKKLTASLLHPDNFVGAQYWQTVLARVREVCKTDTIPVTSFQKVWIKPSEAQVYQTSLPEVFPEDAPDFLRALSSMSGNLAFITQNRLGVFCDEDSFAIQEYIGSHQGGEGNVTGAQLQKINAVAVETFKELVLPVIEEEVNDCLNFRLLRQIYTTCILAKWFKEEFRGRPGYDSIVGTGKPRTFAVEGNAVLVSTGPAAVNRDFKRHECENKYQDMSIPVNQQYYSEYLKLFKNGVFDVIRPSEVGKAHSGGFRRYFSGAIDFTSI